MKRLWVLLCVICVVPSAEAALLISVDGVVDVPFAEVKLQPGETAVIGIHGDGQTPSPWAGYLLVEGPAWIDGHTMVYPGSLSSYSDFPFTDIIDLVPIPPPEEQLEELRDLIGKPELMDFSMIALANGVIPPAPLDGLLVDDIILHCDGLGDVTLSLISDDFATIYDTRDIQQIPEPMTLLLLGVGGLFAVARQGRKRQA
jgi:hypothetical protein